MPKWEREGEEPDYRPNGDWRGRKGDLRDGGHRSPFIARWPGHIRPDRRCTRRSASPTCWRRWSRQRARRCRTAEDGTDLLAALTSHAAAAPPADRPIVHHSVGGRFAVRQDRWQAIFAPGSGGGFSEPSTRHCSARRSGKAYANLPWDTAHPEGQLDDFGTDPGETINLWHAQRARVIELNATPLAVCRGESNGLPFGVLAAQESS
jgi:arylsulfatase A-like enzyme